MKIAEVIVDVSAYPVDRPFDYLIPDEMEELIECGCRVKVPFGARNILGFVVGIKNDTDVPPDKLKPVSSLLDIEPVLTKEMMELAKWMKNETISYEIDCLQVMIPSALRAKYEKMVVLETDAENLEEPLRTVFRRTTKANYKELEKQNLLIPLKKALKEKWVSIETVVKQKGTIKEIRKVKISEDKDFLQKVYENLSNRAKKQKQLLLWMQQHAGEIIEPEVIYRKTDSSPQVLQAVIGHGAAEFVMEEVYRNPFKKDVGKTDFFTLTEEQEKALQPIVDAMDNHSPETFLLHGVTGSGKTEVYLQAIQHCIQQGKEAIVLVPEISLTPQMTNRFRSRFGELVAVMHSGLSIGEKFDEWRKVHHRKVKVVVGARSAVFAPFENVGLIIIDEEHETSYKQEDSPRYHARDVAIWRSKYHRCPVILGSATPSLESYARARKNVYKLLTLKERALKQSLPSVEIVDMRKELKKGNRTMFSEKLAEAIRGRLEKNEQIVLFLNRRGYSSFVLCRDCGTVMQCENCDISLTYHRYNEKLKCHYCGYEQPVPAICPLCGSDHIRYFGTGTQKVEEELTKLFPGARVLRMDVDTTKRKGAHERILEDFGAGKADILLGTQMIAKGLDFPNITLVGVLSADTSLHLPDFRAAERTFQLLTQVSGRAGRAEKPGEVIIQTYSPEHYAIQFAKAQQYEPFYEREMLMRHEADYPPYYYIALVQVSHEDLLVSAEYAKKCTDYLRSRLSFNASIIGPTTAGIVRLQNRYRYQCLIKYKIEPNLIPTFLQLMKIYRTDWMKKGITLTIDLNPTMI
ncbi:primosomal protein N' [Ureibacillus terrenus]|uniref:primosomal protein N' n=1 Tax=Ureibacillus terrenus TaxID=118246 RepID=UPI002E2065A0|nr:primosomal protein N' [Ureibacillus terrenus]